MSPVTDFTKYQPPGVYVSEVVGGVSAVGFGQDVVVALVGKAIGHRSLTEQFQLSGTTAQNLSYASVVGTPVVIGVEIGGAPLTPNVDYVLTVGSPDTTIVRNLTAVVGEDLTFDGLTPAKVAHPFYIEPLSVTVKSSDDSITYVEETATVQGHYIVDYASGTITRTGRTISSNAIATDASVHVAYSHSGIKSDYHVAVTYNYEPDNYGDPYLFVSYSDVVKQYGNAFYDAQTANGTHQVGDILSELSFAAYFAFLNGAASLYCVALSNDATITDWERAFAKLEGISDIDVVVPVSGDAGVHAAAGNHVNAMANNNLERRAILGASAPVVRSDDSLSGAASAVGSTTLIAEASSLSNDRIVLLSPSTINYFNPNTVSVMAVGSQYVAAAVAGICAVQPPYMPLTNNSIAGFYGMSEVRAKTQKTNESRNGLMVFENGANGVIRIKHGLTTVGSGGSVEEREFSVVFAGDRMMQALRAAYENIIGQPITPDTPFNVKSITVGTLESLVSSKYIYSYTDAAVAQSVADPTLILVKFAYKPTYPLNYVSVEFQIDTSTQTITS